MGSVRGWWSRGCRLRWYGDVEGAAELRKGGVRVEGAAEFRKGGGLVADGIA